MSLNVENIEFEFFTEKSEQFTKDFLNYVVTDIPFFAVQDELLYLMHRRNTPHFKIPGYMTVDSKEHIFYFTVDPVPENNRIKIYRYKGMDIERKKFR